MTSTPQGSPSTVPKSELLDENLGKIRARALYDMKFSVSSSYTLNSHIDASHLFTIKRNLRGVNDWQELGLALGMEYSFLDSIDKDKGGDVEKCKTAMLHSWLKTGEATKSSLVTALKKMGEECIADKF